MSAETDLYGLEKLTAIPSAMKPWQDRGMTLVLPQRTEFGEYVLVGCEPSQIQYQHQIGVIDEQGNPLSGIRVVVCYSIDDPNKGIEMPSGTSYWAHGETDLRGDTYRTEYDGWAKHPGQYGGERIWVWDIEQATGDLKLACVKVEYCPIVNTPEYSNTGVRLTFQRRRMTTYRVTGTVRSRKGANVAGLRVRIVDKTAQGDVSLAETVTKAGGVYQAFFSDEGLRLRGRARPDVQARVFAGAKLRGFSEVRYDATTSEKLDVLLNDGVPDDAGRKKILQEIADVTAKLEHQWSLAHQLLESLRAGEREKNQKIALTEGREQYLAQLGKDIGDASTAGNTAEAQRLRAWRTELKQFFHEEDLAIAQKQAEIDALYSGREPIEVRLADLRERLDEHYAALLGDLSTEVPIVMLPVRLETRFRTEVDKTDLLIRIYPDAIHVDAHQDELDDAEVAWGQHYWQLVKAVGATAAECDAAWRQLAEKYGAGRAAWIAEATEPGKQPKLRVNDQFIPPRARALPDYWLALGYLDGQRVLYQTGQTIPKQLPVGPTGLTAAPGSANRPKAEEDMRWMLDFDAAIEAGMALRVSLTSDIQRGLDLLIVVGVKGVLNGAQSAAHLAELLTCHHYTRGLAFVPQGTPTNNTDDASAGYDSRAVPPGMAPFPKPAPLSANADGARTAAALRLPAGFFVGTPHADGLEQDDAAHMNTVLWPATWGYFLEQFMGGALSQATIEQERRHFIRTVRGRGPLPALRVGEQPYGLLPATALNRWTSTANAGADTKFGELLRNLRETWRRSATQAPRVQQDGNLDQDLAEVLALDAISHTYTVRPMLGGDFAANLTGLLNKPEMRARWTAEAPKLQQLLLGLGLKQDSRLTRAAFVFQPYTFGQALVQPDSDPAHANTASTYIHRLLDEGYDVIRGGFGYAEPLLYLLLRHSSLLAYDAAARRLASRYGLAVEGEGREAELVDFDEPPSTSTPWLRLERAIPALGMSAGAYLDIIKQDPTKVVPATREATAAFLEFWESLRYLASRPADALERTMTETLDLCSHRLDAWITSLATERLSMLRKGEIAIGGYGWLEDVRPGDATPSHGFVQAPSLAHAATAAVLRNGYLAHGGVATDNSMAVDLSSARVRLAEWFLEGVRQGQPLAALLGYRFERGLHERHLDSYIRRFRLIAPLAALTDIKEIRNIAEEWIALEDQAATADRDAAQKQSEMENKKKQRDAADPKMSGTEAFQVEVDHARVDARGKELVKLIDEENQSAVNAERDRATAEAELANLPARSYRWERDPPDKPKKVADPNESERLRLTLAIENANRRRDEANRQSQSYQEEGLLVIIVLWDLGEAKKRNADIFSAKQTALTLAELEWQDADTLAADAHVNANKEFGKLPDEIKPRALAFKKVRDLEVTIRELKTELEQLEGNETTGGAIRAKRGEIRQAEDRKNLSDARIDQLEADLSKAKGDVIAARLQLDILETKLKDPGVQYEYEGHLIVRILPNPESSRNDKIQADIAKAERALRSAEDTVERITKEKTGDMAVATQEKADAQASIAALEEELGKLTDRAGSLPAELNDLTVQLFTARLELDPPNEVLEAIPAHDVVDGWELLDRWQRGLAGSEHEQWDNTTIPFGKLGLPTAGADYDALRAELAALAGAADAVSDLVTAESVYHMVQGNPTRASATLNAVAQGETLPEREVIHTPRSGIALTHRIAMLFGGPAPAAPSWSPRAQAEPRLNHWVGQVLGDLAQVTFSAWGVDQGSDTISIPPIELNLSQLAMEPLDLIYAGEGSEEAQRAEIEQRAVHLLLKDNPDVTDPIDVHLDFGASQSAINAILEASRAIHALFAGARPADGAALKASSDNAQPTAVDLQDLQQRADAAVQGLIDAFNDLPADKEPDETTDAPTLHQRLLSLASFGVSGTTPAALTGDTTGVRRVLWEQAWGCRDEVSRRLDLVDQINKAAATPPSATDHLSRLEAVFGRQFRVMPTFGPVARLTDALGTTGQQAENGREVVRWFQRIARVREGVSRLDAALMVAEAMSENTPLDLRVFQFPPPEIGEKWVAVSKPAGGRLSLVVQAMPGFAPAGTLAGLIIDDWVEVVPAAVETTGVTFHFDAPGAQAPQAILLAVPPVPSDQREKWDVDTLADIVLETLEMAQLRLVTQETLGEIGHFLPALYFAINASGDTISTEFTGFEP